MNTCHRAQCNATVNSPSPQNTVFLSNLQGNSRIARQSKYMFLKRSKDSSKILYFMQCTNHENVDISLLRKKIATKTESDNIFFIFGTKTVAKIEMGRQLLSSEYGFFCFIVMLSYVKGFQPPESLVIHQNLLSFVAGLCHYAIAQGKKYNLLSLTQFKHK